MNNIKYSFIAPAIRSHLYKQFCDNLYDPVGKIPFEIIFVGNEVPIEKMPSNFKYIFTDVENWAQCLEIAARNAIGEYLIVASDDVTFFPGFLEIVEDYIGRLDMSRTFISFPFKQNDIPCTDALMIRRDVVNSPVVGVSGLFKKDVWMSLGGLDRRFPGSLADIDMVYRFYEKGYSLFILNNCYLHERIANQEIKDANSMFYRTIEIGGKVFNRLWFKDNLFLKNRSDKVWSFSDTNIMEEDQFEIDNTGSVVPNVSLTIEPFAKRFKCSTITLSDGKNDKDYLIEFLNATTKNTLYSIHLRARGGVCCFPDPWMNKMVARVSSTEDGVIFQKTIRL